VNPYQKAAEEKLAETIRAAGLQVTRKDQERLVRLIEELSRLPEMVAVNDVRYQEASDLVYRALVYGCAGAEPRYFEGLVPRFNKD
jgi:signal transduction histidine kinase